MTITTNPELQVKVNFLDEYRTINHYDQKYHTNVNNIKSDNLVELNTLIETNIDNTFYEIYLKAIAFENGDEENNNFSVIWGMSNLNFVEADIPQPLQDVAQGIIKDVIKDIFERFSEETDDNDSI